MSEFNLSEKEIIVGPKERHIYWAEDVREFIKRLSGILADHLCQETQDKIIDKLAGEKLR